jgi:serine/threonine-protein kinase
VYVLEERIGSGGMGTVWRGRNTETGEAIAVKMLADNLSQDRELVARFLQERAALTGVHHPNLVQIRDLVAEQDRLGLVMDLVQGVDAGRALQAGPLSPARVARIGYEVCQALVAIHAAGIVHRDLKPANILLDEQTGSVRLADFGIALLAGSTRLTAVNSVVGTPHYLAPELLIGGDAGPAADVYALGICVYELLTGTVPFTGEHYAQILQQHLYAQAQPHPAIPPGTWQLIQVMLSKNPAERQDAAGTGGWFFQLLNEYSAGGSAPAIAPSPTIAIAPVPQQPPYSTAQPAQSQLPAVVSQPAPVPSQGNPSTPVPFPGNPPTPVPLPSGPPSARWDMPVPAPPAGQYDPSVFDSGGPGLSYSSGPFSAAPVPKKGKRRWVLVSSIAAVVVLGAGGTVFALSQGGSTKQPAAAGTSTATASPHGTGSVAAGGKGLLDTWLMTGSAHDSVGGRNGVATNVHWTVLTNGTGSVGLHGVAGSQVVVNGPVFNTEGSFSLGVWITRQGPTATPSGWQTVIAQRGGNVDGAAIEFNPTADRWAFDMPQADADAASVDAVMSHVAPVVNSWYHVVATYDGTTHLMSLYVNGQLQGTSVHTADWVAAGNLSIGSGLSDAGPTNWLDGSLSDVQVWNRALDASEVGGLG